MMNRRALTAVLAALLWAVVLSPSPAPAEETAEKPLRIGVLAFRGVAHAMRSWMPMARYLSARVAKARFQIVPLPLPDLRQATEQGTISDAASGLTWQKSDDGKTREWPGALAYCEGLSLAGRDDWRLPNVKELQHIVDYRRPQPVIDTQFFVQRDAKAWFWSSTTHGEQVRMANYVCFGKCISVEGADVHGAGAQRSDPKTGDPSKWPAMGGQRGLIRILNHARCVRDG